MPYDPPIAPSPKAAPAQGLWFLVWLLCLVYGSWDFGWGAGALLVVSSLAVVGWLHD